MRSRSPDRLVLAVRFLYIALVAGTVAAALGVIWRLGWMWLARDQWEFLRIYLELDFPANVLALHNGHRTIFPSLVELADLTFFGAHNYLSTAVGAALAFFTAVGLSWFLWRADELPSFARTLAVGTIWLSVFWLGNVRILGHSLQSACVHFVTASLACALVSSTVASEAVLAGQRVRAAVWWIGAALACGVATFSFGPGIVSWPAALLVPLSLGVGWRALWPLVAGLLVCLWLYLWVLPGEVGAFIEVRPWEAVRNASLWLGSPVYHLLKSFGLSAGGARSLGALAGALASVALPVLWWTRPRGPASRAEAGFFSVAAFALGTALVVGLTRTGQHAATPGEVVAVRHLTWPSLFWAASLILWGLRAHCARRYRSAAVRSWAALLAALPLLMIQVQLDFVRAYEEIHHRMRLGLFALIVGVRDDDAVRFVRRGFDVVYAMAEELRARKLGIFAWDEARLLGRPLEAVLHPAADGVAGGIVALRPLPGDASGAKFRGWAIDTSTREPPRYAVAVNSAGRITGLGGFGRPRPEVARAAGLDPATRIGLVGYIRDYDPEARYRFFAVREDGVTAVPLSVLPAPRG